MARRQPVAHAYASANSSGGIRPIAEHLDTGPADIPEPAATELSVGNSKSMSSASTS